MGTMIDDDVKQKLLNSLADEPTMVLATAYAYAKNYVAYGEDITKAWTTAVQQASVIQEVRQKAWVEAYESFKKEYENIEVYDKETVMWILRECQLEIDMEAHYKTNGDLTLVVDMSKVNKIIQDKINSLRTEIKPRERSDKE